LPPKSPKVPQESLVHLTRSQSARVPFAETFWVIVESNATGPQQQQVHQIQMWRVTVLRNVNSAPTNPIPRKET
jgi:hypothetical protein